MCYWLRWFCLSIILTLLSNISVSSGVDEAVKCAIKIDDPSTFKGSDLTLAGIHKMSELAGGVIIINSDIAFTEQNFDTERENIALFIKNETAVHAFYRLRGELYAKTFELVSDSEGKGWVEGELQLLDSARRSYPKNIVARGKNDYYLYDKGECTALTNSTEKNCPCASEGKNGRCVYDSFVNSTVIVSPSTYNRIACNEFSEVDGIFQVIVNKKPRGPVMCKDSTLQFVQLYDRKWTNRKRVCEAVKIPEVTVTTATTPMHITEGSSASSSTVVEFSTSPSISVGMSTSTSISTPAPTSSSTQTPTPPSITLDSSSPTPYSVETIPFETVPAETTTVGTSSFGTGSTDESSSAFVITDATSTEATSTDATSTDATSTDPTSIDATSIDATSIDATSIDATSTDATSTDATSTDATSTDATSIDATSTDATSTDATSTDATSTDATSTDAMSTDAMSTDAMSTDAMSTDAMSTDAMSTDEPSFTQSPSPTRQSSSTVQPSFTQNHDGRSSPVMSSSAYETQSTVSGTNIVPLKLSSGKGSPTAYITVLALSLVVAAIAGVIILLIYSGKILADSGAATTASAGKPGGSGDVDASQDPVLG